MALKQILPKALLVRVAVFTSVVAFALMGSAPVFGQGLRVAVTLDSNLQYEGTVKEVIGYSVIPVSPDTGDTFYLDDGLRRVFFNKKRLDSEPVPLTYPLIEFPIWQDAVDKNTTPGILRGSFSFDEHGHRVIRVEPPGKNQTFNFVQGITKIAPEYVEVKTLKNIGPKNSFHMSLGLGAVPKDTIRSMLHNQIKRGDSPVEFENIFGFYLRSQQYGEALAELDLIERKFPERKERCENFREQVRQDQARQVIEEIKRRIENGQTKVARWLSGEHMNKDGVAQQLLFELQAELDKLDEDERKLQEVQAKIVELVKRFQSGRAPGNDSSMLGNFLAELESELSTSNVGRLDSYFVQANDATQTDEQKVALAISGWIVGSNVATPNYATAKSMFDVRELIRSYLRSGDAGERASIVSKLKTDFEAGRPELVAAMLAQMKPLEHDTATLGYTGEKPIEFSVVLPGTKADPADQEFRVLVHLPLQYDPYHPYPLLLTLPDNGTSADDQLAFFTEGFVGGEDGGRVGVASRNGVIVASVQWQKPGVNGPEYSAREHGTVLGAMRACFRKFAIDTDRVFVHGHQAGASLAYDIGLAHPEHFAGLIPVGGNIEKFARVHAKNRNGNLAIRAVVGEGDRITEVTNTATWNTWLRSNRYVDLSLVQYKGRLNEKFPDDLKAMFAWMEFQRRSRPTPAGFQFSAESLRPWDNYYWFLELHGFPRANTTWPQLWRLPLKALEIEGELRPATVGVNRFSLSPSRAGTGMTLWLSPDFVDFAAPIRISGRGNDFGKMVKPSTATILDDVRRRADRLRPYWARLDCNAGKWSVVE